MSLQVVGLTGIGEIRPGDDLVEAIAAALTTAPWPDGTSGVRDGDIVVVTSKIVSKAEGRIVPDAERDAALDAETTVVVAVKQTPRGETRIVRTRHGLVLAAAGIDASNAPAGHVLLLPVDPDASARGRREAIRAATSTDVAIVISDSIGRPFRRGTVGVAIGAAGFATVVEHAGRPDDVGREFHSTQVHMADQLASTAELALGPSGGVPAVLIRGVVLEAGDEGAAGGIIDRDKDLFA